MALVTILGKDRAICSVEIRQRDRSRGSRLINRQNQDCLGMPFQDNISHMFDIFIVSTSSFSREFIFKYSLNRHKVISFLIDLSRIWRNLLIRHFSSPTLWSLPKIKLELNCQSDGFEAKVSFMLEKTRMKSFLAKSMSSKSLPKKFTLPGYSGKNSTNIGKQNDIQMHLWRWIHWNWKHLWWHKRVRRLYRGSKIRLKLGH